MSNALCCPLCGVEIKGDEEGESQQLQIIHVLDHVQRDVLDIGVEESGGCDVLNYCSNDRSWSGAWRSAWDFVLTEYGDLFNVMVGVAAQIPLRPIGRPDSPATFIEVPVTAPKELMVAWLEQHAELFGAAPPCRPRQPA